jgi:hypothetical protein
MEATDAPPHARKEWEDAIDEYFVLERQAKERGE